MNNHNCPICSKPIHPDPRYPKYVCKDCALKATDGNNRPLQFHNTGMGGFIAHYIDTKEVYHSNVCYINGIKCWADEARFGGIVIEIMN